MRTIITSNPTYYYDAKKLVKDVILDKNQAVSTHINYMLDRTQRMFKYDGLPDTIPARFLELMLQTYGNVFITKVKGELYAFNGGLGGPPDPYYRPTLYTVANPALEYSASLKIGEEGVLMYNDTMMQGLVPIFAKFGTLLSENDITMRTASINMRLMSILSVTDDKTKAAALEYLKEVEKGNLGVLVDGRNMLMDKDNFTVAPTVTTAVSNYMTQLAEYNQYLRACEFNDLGLQANYNMKRETLNSSETEMDSDILIPLTDEMLHCREEALEQVNAMYGTNITVSLDSAWEDKQIMRDLQQEVNEAQIENAENPEEPDEEKTEDKEESTDESKEDD